MTPAAETTESKYRELTNLLKTMQIGSESTSFYHTIRDPQSPFEILKQTQKGGFAVKRKLSEAVSKTPQISEMLEKSLPNTIYSKKGEEEKSSKRICIPNTHNRELGKTLLSTLCIHGLTSNFM
jgi:hypothetical protein